MIGKVGFPVFFFGDCWLEFFLFNMSCFGSQKHGMELGKGSGDDLG